MATWLQLGFQDASSPLMEELIYFHDYVLIMLVLITMIVFYGLFSLLFMYSTNRFFLDSQIIETMWTVVPAFILVFMAFPSLQLLYLIDEVNDPCLTMKALGHQWYWSYEFTDYHSLDFDSYMISVDDMSYGTLRLLEVDNRVIIPSHNSMRVLVSSSDVLHSWAVPSLGMKMDAVPGRLNQVTFMIPRSGLFYGQCSEICGSNHSFMPIVLESVPFKVFETWVSNYIVD